mmetsp:Transcript_5942/g.24879  ORF Transcript_5942/g.24879 Transcript_5942/m.24879 type:complete len:90 (+) Transcript_5942:1853-2122(+)
MKVLAALFVGVAGVAAFTAPRPVPQRVAPVHVNRREIIETAAPLAVALALAAPTAAQAAKPPQLESMLPTKKGKSGQIKTGNAGSILKK